MKAPMKTAACAGVGILLSVTSLAAARPQPARPRLTAHTAATVAHFDYPLGVATDTAGDVYVANYGNSYINKISPGLSVVKSFKITQDLSGPISIAVDPAGDIYAGSINGGVEQYSPAGIPQQAYTANASDPASIAADQFGDVYIAGPNGLALDDPYGNSLDTDLNGLTPASVAIGGASVYAFSNDNLLWGNGSIVLRQGSFEQERGDIPSQDPAGSACSAAATCWIDDVQAKTLSVLSVYAAASQSTVALPYEPAGVAYDPVHQRVFVADPVGNAIQVYNATTLALIKTIT